MRTVSLLLPAFLLPAIVALLAAACDPASDAPPTDAGTPSSAPSGERWTAVEKLVRAKDYAGARTALEAELARAPDDPEVLVRLAEVQRLSGDQAGGILLLRGALERKPDASQLYLPLAQYQMAIEDYASAIGVLERGLQHGSDEAETATLLGMCLARRGEHEPALAAFERARAAGKPAPVVEYNRALVLSALGKHAEALAALDLTLAAEPKWAAARRERAREFLRTHPQDRPGVERVLDELVDLAVELPDDWRVQEGIGDCWLIAGDYEAALQAYTEALRLGQNPPSVESRYREAALRLRERRAAAGTEPAGGGGG